MPAPGKVFVLLGEGMAFETFRLRLGYVTRGALLQGFVAIGSFRTDFLIETGMPHDVSPRERERSQIASKPDRDAVVVARSGA